MPDYKTIDEYIAAFPEDVQKILQEMRETIHDAAPDAEEVISYGIPTFNLYGKHLVHFGGFKKHISFFPTGAGVEAFEEEAGEYKTGPGTMQFSLTKPVPFDLVYKITEFRGRQIAAKRKI